MGSVELNFQGSEGACARTGVCALLHPFEINQHIDFYLFFLHFCPTVTRQELARESKFGSGVYILMFVRETREPAWDFPGI